MRYTHDLTDTQWNLIAYCFPPPAKTGRPRKHSYRELLNGCLYVVRTSCQWRNLPKDLPPWATVYHYFRQWTNTELLERIHTHLREHIRLLEGRKRQPTAGSIDSQSVKGSETCGERTFGWLGRYRRLSRDYERRAKVAEAMVYLAMSRLMLARWVKN